MVFWPATEVCWISPLTRPPSGLHEGSTPLIPMPRLAEELGGGFELFVKFEGMNPTGSFKDRGMTVAISEAAGRGAKAVICASTGNTAASAAAYAARAGMRAIVIIPEGKVAAGKLAGAVAYGAEVIQIDGSFDDALSLVVEVSQKQPIALVEFAQPLPAGRAKRPAPLKFARTWRARPTGCACRWATPAISPLTGWASASITASKAPACRASSACRRPGPRRWCSATRLITPTRSPPPSASADPARGEQAIQAAEESKGQIIAVTDDEILSMQRRLAAERRVGRARLGRRGRRAGARAARRADGRDRPARGRRLHRAWAEGPGIIAQSMPAPRKLAARVQELEAFILKGNQMSPAPLARGVRVRVPATSANLGPGFDCLGLALDLWNEAVFTLEGEGLRLRCEGEGKNIPHRQPQPGGAGHALLLRHARPALSTRGFDRLQQPHPGQLRAGLQRRRRADRLLGAAALLGQPLETAEALTLSARMEGHADNAAAALMGGLVIVAAGKGGAWLTQPIAIPDRQVAVVLPAINLPTHAARAALPGEIAMKDVTYNLGRAMLVVEALRSDDLALLSQAMDDRLHLPYRLPLIPGGQKALDAALQAGASAVTISGAGPSLIAFTPGDPVEQRRR